MIRFLKVLALLVALALPYSVKADMLTGGTFIQVPTGLNTSIKPEFTMAPTIAIRLWTEVRGLKIGVEGSTYSTALDLSDSTTGWGGAAYMKVRSINFGTDGVLHVLVKGGFSSVDGWSLDQKQYQVGPVFDADFDGRKAGSNGTAAEVGVYWQSAESIADMIGVQTQLVFDVQ